MSILEHFSLRWNNFHTNMSAGFCALLQEDALVDVTLAAEGRFLQAHRLVLSVCSPYFKQLFAANPCKHPIVILKDVHHKQMSDLLNFMYQGEVNVKQEDLATFLRTAELLQIKGLTGQESYSDQHQDSDHVREDHQHTAVSGEHIPNVGPRQRAVRRPRQHDKLSRAALSALISSSADTHLSPAPSPPPVKRIKPSSSEPVSLTTDDDLRDEVSGSRGSECEGQANDIKLEPSPEFDSESFSSHNEENKSLASANDSVLRKALTPQTSQSHPVSPIGGLQETEEPIKLKHLNHPTQFLQQEGLAAAGSSGTSVPTTEGSSSSSSSSVDQGSLVPQYVHSRKGGLQLVLDGFLYTVHQQQGRNKYWRCVERGKLGCQGYCKTFMQEEGEVVRQLRSHNHGRQDDKIQERVNATRLRLQVLHALAQRQGTVSYSYQAARSGSACGPTIQSLKTE